MDFANNFKDFAVNGFDQAFLDEAVCRERLLSFLHPGGPACPWCGQAVFGPVAVRRFFAGKVLKCPACGSKFSGRSGTILAKVKLTYAETISFCLLLALGLPVKVIARRLGLRIRTAYTYQERFSKEMINHE